MSTKLKISLIISAVVIYTVAIVTGSYFLFRCKTGSIETGKGKAGPTKIIALTGTTIDKCKALKFESKMDQAGKILRVNVWNNCLSSYVDIPITCKLPQTWKKNIILLRPMGLFGYNSAIKKLDMLYGGSAGYTRMLSPMLGIGPDIIYLKSAVTPDWYAGAAVNILCQFDDFKKWK